ncbi:carnitine acyl carrier-like protein [Syncephalis fuscata]|nr:carnitine acyl carrier-like protein [Syncephalis fuscata]
MAQVIVGQPLDTVKVRLQVENASKGRFQGPWHCMADTVRHEGFLALYKGMAAPLVGISAVNALLFTTYSTLKDLQTRQLGLPSTEQLGSRHIALAGAGAGIVNSLLASPVEMLKVRLQVQRSLVGMSHSPAIYRGPIDLARAIITTDGWRHGLMRGFWITVVREIPAYAAFYTSFELMKRRLTTSNSAADQTNALMLAGSTAGISCWCACYPFDVIKSRAQNSSQRLTPNYITKIAREIYHNEGMAGFWRGFMPCVLRSIPAAAATFTTYELVMQSLH